MTRKTKSRRGIGDPPENIRPEEIEIWNELKSLRWKIRLTSADRFAFGMLCSRLALERAGRLRTPQDPVLLELLRDFGLTPGSRMPKFA